MGLTADTEEFSTRWLGSPNAYERLNGLSLLELASLVHSLEFGLGLQECVYQDDWQDAQTERDRWQTRVRLSALRLQLIRLRRWKRECGWQEALFD